MTPGATETETTAENRSRSRDRKDRRRSRSPLRDRGYGRRDEHARGGGEDRAGRRRDEGIVTAVG